jgi:nitrate/nitrite transporter NarK
MRKFAGWRSSGVGDGRTAGYDRPASVAAAATDGRAAADGNTRVRRTVLFLLVLHYANTYMDRVCIAAVAPAIRAEFGLDHVQMGLVFTAFSVSYSLFQLPGGWLADRFGPRRVLSGLVVYWSIFTLATAAAWSHASLLVARFLFGSGEAGAFPAATRAVSRWFPADERGFVQGITHTGARLGGAVTPPLVAWLAVWSGWRVPFLLFAVLGFLWVLVWYRFFRDTPEEHPRVSALELRAIRADRPKTGREEHRVSVPWRALLTSRNVWALCLMYFCYVYTFWLFLTWFPTYLMEARGFSAAWAGLLAGLPLGAGALTNTLGGWFSDRLSRQRGLRFGRRSIAVAGFLGCALFAVTAILHPSPVWAVVCFTLMAAALESTTGVSWAVAVDIGREYAGTVSGLMNMYGNVGGAISPLVLGLLVRQTGAWEIPLGLAAGFCLVAALLWLRIDPEATIAPRPVGPPSSGSPEFEGSCKP